MPTLGAPGGAQRSGEGGERRRLGEEGVFPRESLRSGGSSRTGREEGSGGGELKGDCSIAAALRTEAGPEWLCVCVCVCLCARPSRRGGGSRAAVSQCVCLCVSERAPRAHSPALPHTHTHRRRLQLARAPGVPEKRGGGMRRSEELHPGWRGARQRESARSPILGPRGRVPLPAEPLLWRRGPTGVRRAATRERGRVAVCSAGS